MMVRSPIWQTKRLGDIAEFRNGINYTKDSFGIGIKVIGVSNFQEFSKPNYFELDQINPEGVVKLSDILQDGDIVFVRSNGNRHLIGRSLYIEKPPFLVTHSAFTIRLRFNDGNVLPKFYAYFFKTSMIRQVLTAYGGGTNISNLNQNILNNIEVPYPSILHQNQIVSILSAYDDLIENNLRRVKILEEMAQNHYREWFVNFRFPGHENIRFVDSPMGRIPEGWEVASVEQIVQRIPSGKKYDQKTVYAVGSVPVLDQGRSGIIGYHDDEPGVFASGNTPIIVFANHTCYQRLVMFPFSAIQNVLPFLSNPQHQRNIYWLHYATKDLVVFNDYKGHWPEFMAKQILLPPLLTCTQFGGFVEPLTRLVFKLEVNNLVLRQTRDLLLPKLISGEADVSDLDINLPEEAMA